MQGWTCLPDNEDVFDAHVGLQVSGEQPFQNLFYMSLLHLHTRLDAIVSCKNHATNYTCILHQQLECKRIQTSLYPPLFTIIVVLIYIYVFLCSLALAGWFQVDPYGYPPATPTVSVAGLARTDRALCCWGHGGFQIRGQGPWRWQAARARRGGSHAEKPRGVPLFYKSVSLPANTLTWHM